jgi:hypothetical protein
MKPPSLRTPSQRAAEQRRLFRPYANELGWLVYQWNRLQQAMAELFTDLVTPDKPVPEKPPNNISPHRDHFGRDLNLSTFGRAIVNIFAAFSVRACHHSLFDHPISDSSKSVAPRLTICA